MAITTVDGVLAGAVAPRAFYKSTIAPGAVGRVTTLWAVAGCPGAGAYDTTLNGVTLSSTAAQVTGQIPLSDPGSGNNYLARLSALHSGATGGYLILADRLWHNGGYTITSTGAQATTFPTLLARDANGATNGDGVLLAVEVSATVGAATPTITIAYTNSAGTASRSATNLDATVSAGVAGLVYRISLQAGDAGVRSVQSLTLSASYLSGTINLVAYRPLAVLEIGGVNVPNAIDALSSSFPKLYNGTVPYLMWVPGTNTAGTLSGMFAATAG